MNFIDPQSIHCYYGVKKIDGVNFIKLEKSNRKYSKYAITVQYKNVVKTVHYGDKRYEQFFDNTPLHCYAGLNHCDSKRRANYLTRASKIRNKSGLLCCNDPFSPNRYSMITLW